MSDAVADGFVPRGADLVELREIEDAVRADERDRRVRKFVITAAPWVLAGCMTLVASGAMGVMWKRPAVHDRLAIGIVTNGVYEAPTLREDLPADRRAILFDYSVNQYIKARMNYSYESMPENQRRVLAMSAPQEADRYSAMLHDERDPENPLVKYGTGSDAGTAMVEAIKINPQDPNAPNTVDALFILRVQMPHQPVKHLRMVARMSFVEAGDKIDMGVQKMWDPAGIAFLNFSAGADVGAGQ